jgi:hypothetical protein
LSLNALVEWPPGLEIKLAIGSLAADQLAATVAAAKNSLGSA